MLASACNCSTGYGCSTWRPHGKHFVSIVLSFLGLPGNVIVIILIFRAKQKKSTTTCLLLSLAIADVVNLLGVNVTGCLVLLMDKPRKHKWTISLFTTIPSKVAANLTLAMIALTRYNAIVNTMKSFMRVTRRKIVIGVAVSWLIGWTLCTLIAVHNYLHRYNSRHSPSRNRTLGHNCTLNAVWSRRPLPNRIKAYWSALLVFGYIIPLLVVVFCYSSILKGLYIDGTVLGEKVADKTRLNEKKRLVRCLLVITSVFVVCNVPAIIIQVLEKKGYYQILKVLNWASSLLNPFIYALQSENYRNQVKLLFCKSQELNENVIVRFPPVAYDTKL